MTNLEFRPPSRKTEGVVRADGLRQGNAGAQGRGVWQHAAAWAGVGHKQEQGGEGRHHHEAAAARGRDKEVRRAPRAGGGCALRAAAAPRSHRTPLHKRRRT